MDWHIILLIVAAGILVGFINTLAGSGSIISLPLLIFLGLPANVANGTNRIAILLQSLTGVLSFKKKKVLDTTKYGLYPTIAAVLGSIIGALIAIDIDKVIMERVIGVVMVIMLFVVLYKPEKWLKEKKTNIEKPGFLQLVIFFVIGIYGGFIQAGVGIFLLVALVLNAGYDLVRANALKLLIVLLYTPFALLIFILNGQVNWEYGLILSAGNIIGALIATKFAVDWGPKFIRYILIAVIITSSLDLLGIIDLF